MDWVQVLILSVVEGVTEFLPISSTGHLILASKLLGVAQTEFVKSFEIVIQLGAIAAVAWESKEAFRSFKSVKAMMWAFVPTGVIGFGLYRVVKTYLLGNAEVVVWALLLGGVGMIIWEKLQTRDRKLQISDLNVKRSFLIGVLQAVSVIPGVSRALMTIMGGMMMGLSRIEAVKFSFVLAIPTMVAATGLDLVKSGWSFTANEWLILGVGFAGAYFSAWIVVRWLIGYVQKHNFVAFGVYRIALALVFGLLI